MTIKNRKKITKDQREELNDYVRHYTERGIVGVWWELAIAIKTACAEIDRARVREKQLRKIRKLIDNADLSFITSERHGKLVETIDEIRKVFGVNIYK